MSNAIATVKEWFRRLGGTLRPRPADRDLADELELHLQLAREAREHDGQSPGAARRSARIAAGSTASAMDALRDQRGVPWLTEAVRDAAYALRFFRRAPAYSAAVVATLAVGIGATTTVFSIVNELMLRPLPFPESGRLVGISESDPLNEARRNPSIEALKTWRAQSQSFESLAVVAFPVDFSLQGRRVRFLNADVRLLEVLGIQPAAGRGMDLDDIPAGWATQTSLISYDLWKDMFAGQPDILGKPLPDWSVRFGGTVVGVTPPGFWVFPEWSDLDGYFGVDSERMPPDVRRFVIGRLRPGVAPLRAAAELTALLHTTSASDPDAPDYDVVIEPLQAVLSEGYSGTLYPFMAAVGFVLLISCANIATLQLNKTIAREPEMATRIALGAGRLRLVRQHLAENLLLAAVGGAAGLVLSLVGIRLFGLVAPVWYPPAGDVSIDGTVLGFTLALAVVAGIGFGIVPAIRASRVNPRSQLGDGTRGTPARAPARLRHALVVGEVALSVLLLVGAGLMLNSYVRLINFDIGFDTDDLLTWEVSLVGLDGYRIPHVITTHMEILPANDIFFSNLLERVQLLPGVEMAGFASSLPPAGGYQWPARPLGEDRDVLIRYQEISPGFLETAGIAMISGRGLTERDVEDAPPVALLNQTAARQLFGDAAPLGRSLQIGVTGDNSDLEPDPLREVVGIVADTLDHPWNNEATPTAYIPYRQHVVHHAGVNPSMATARKLFIVRTRGDAGAALGAGIRESVHALDARVAVDEMMPMRERMGRTMPQEQFLVRVLGGFACLAVLLAAVGIYGVVAYSAAQREREFGIRSALGARTVDIRLLVLRGAALLAASGLAIGLLSAVVLTRVLQTQLPLFEITPTDPVTLTSVCTLLATVTLLASCLPVWKAGKLNPMKALNEG